MASTTAAPRRRASSRFRRLGCTPRDPLQVRAAAIKAVGAAIMMLDEEMEITEFRTLLPFLLDAVRQVWHRQPRPCGHPSAPRAARPIRPAAASAPRLVLTLMLNRHRASAARALVAQARCGLAEGRAARVTVARRTRMQCSAWRRGTTTLRSQPSISSTTWSSAPSRS